MTEERRRLVRLILSMPETGKTGDTSAYITFGVSDNTSPEFELQELRSLIMDYLHLETTTEAS